MAVDVTQLAQSLRLTDDEAAPTGSLLGILERLLGVGEAVVELRAPAAPQVSKDEAIISMASYLYDRPKAAAEASYANAWRFSGAASLVAPWDVQRLGDASAEALPLSGSGGGLSDAERARLLPDTAADGQVAVYQDASGLWIAEDIPAGEGGTEDVVARAAAAAAAQDVVTHDSAGDSHEDIRDAIEGRVTQGDVETTAQRLIDSAGHASNVDLGRAGDRIDTNRDNLTTHEGTPHGGGNGGGADQTARDAAAAAQATADGAQTDIDDHEANHPTNGGGGTPTPTPPTVLVDGAAYAAHGDVTVAGWRGYDFVQLFYTNTDTYTTPAVNTAQLIAFTSLIVPVGRNVHWTLAISTTDDDVITTAQSTSGNGVAAPTATSTMTVIAWRAG